jgi:hypothetical protein
LKDRPEAYQTLCKLWASEEFIAKSIRAREYRGTGGPSLIFFFLQEKYKEEVLKKHNEDFNYEEELIDGQAVYDSGGGKTYGR